MNTKRFFHFILTAVLFAAVLVSCHQEEFLASEKMSSDERLKTGRTSDVDLGPVIHSFNPLSGFYSAGSQDPITVAIEGANFGPELDPTAVVVKFNGVEATILQSFDTHLLISIPEGAKTGKISVELDGFRTLSEHDFTIVSERSPVIMGYSALAGRPGTQMSINGLNFSTNPEENAVRFNGIPARVNEATSNELVVTIPDYETTGPITVGVEQFESTGSQDFTISRTPLIELFEPASGTPGISVNLYGWGFSPVASENEVKFNGVSAVVTHASSTQLLVTVPVGATTGPIAVTIDGFTGISSTDFIVTVPVIQTFLPASGRPGTQVTITGLNFSPSRSSNIVRFNGVAASVISASASQLVVAVPSLATTGRISVSVGGATATSSTDFTVPAAAVPVISDFFPRSVTRAEINQVAIVTIQGVNFSPVASQNQVRFGLALTDAQVLSATANQLIVVIPTGTQSGFITVIVNGQLGRSSFPLTVREFVN